jgi:hypothetical protein
VEKSAALINNVSDARPVWTKKSDFSLLNAVTPACLPACPPACLLALPACPRSYIMPTVWPISRRKKCEAAFAHDVAVSRKKEGRKEKERKKERKSVSRQIDDTGEAKKCP